ncbi:hypothetical protein HDU87_001829 [Geranomyces variabilis]|uniref:Uncharacterized protein n=1 Tax=Geranomyces variabilis TaxID=109894 RepID=A0AAD5TS32_9FUNG|nr:hypothetical protein HDU87_001829 [Geranomyces variabilis]
MVLVTVTKSPSVDAELAVAVIVVRRGEDDGATTAVIVARHLRRMYVGVAVGNGAELVIIVIIIVDVVAGVVARHLQREFVAVVAAAGRAVGISGKITEGPSFVSLPSAVDVVSVGGSEVTIAASGVVAASWLPAVAVGDGIAAGTDTSEDNGAAVIVTAGGVKIVSGFSVSTSVVVCRSRALVVMVAEDCFAIVKRAVAVEEVGKPRVDDDAGLVATRVELVLLLKYLDVVLVAVDERVADTFAELVE